MSNAIPQRLTHLLTNNLRSVPDFPEPGVLFRDITPLLANGEAFQELIVGFADHYRGKIDMVAGLESRGFLLAAPLAARLEIGMLMVRKQGKLPGPVIGIDYELEYGSARMEIQPDTVPAGASVLVLDDVLATGGTAHAAVSLIRKAGGVVNDVTVLMELVALQGRKKLEDVRVNALLEL